MTIGARTLARAVAGALALSLVAFAAPALAASLPPGPSTEILLPPDARLTAALGTHALPLELVHASGLACSSASSCVAVGRYLDATTLTPHAMAVSESGGVWERAVRIAPPPDAPAAADARLDAVACPAAGSCIAIGSSLGTPMAVSQTAGAWGRAVRLPGPNYSSLACNAPRSCVAVGVSGAGLAAVSQTAGTWGEATQIAMPPDALPSQATLAGVACTAVGRCVAVGRYPVAGGATRPFAVSETGGAWGTAQAVGLSPNMAGDLAVSLSSVACAAADPCVAVGSDTTRQGRERALGAFSTAGVFGPAALLAPAPGRPATADSGLNAVACSAAGRCATVGAGRDNEDITYAIAATGSGGAWGPTSVIARMPDAAGRDIAQLRQVACDGAGSCMAIGTYVSDTGANPSMAVRESGGTWAAPALVTGPPGSLGASVALLACPGSGPCVAVGGYADDDGNGHLMSAGSTPAAPGATVRLVASRIAARPGGRAIIRLRCTGTASCTGRLKLTARRPATRTRRAGKASVVARKTFKIVPGTTGRIAIRLSSRGWALLRAAHSHLTATLTVLKSAPAPARAKTWRIRLIKPGR